MAYAYPGNIRELANVIEHAFILCKTGVIEKKHLPEEFLVTGVRTFEKDASSFRDVETNYLINALKQNNWNRPQTARQLGMHKSTLYRKIKALRILLPD